MPMQVHDASARCVDHARSMGSGEPATTEATISGYRVRRFGWRDRGISWCHVRSGRSDRIVGRLMAVPYYQDDHVTIYHGDCLELLHDLTFDVVVTDPPYGIKVVSGGSKTNTKGVRTAGKPVRIVGDKDTKSRDQMLGMVSGVPALVFGSWKAPRPVGVVDRLLWIKQNTTPCIGRARWSSADEEIYVIGEWENNPTDVNYMVTTEARAGSGGLASLIGHPTPKPVDLMRWLLGFCDGVVVDPFMGSGSTLRAAKDLGRKAIGVEIDERYCEIAAKRMGQEVLDFG